MGDGRSRRWQDQVAHAYTVFGVGEWVQKPPDPNWVQTGTLTDSEPRPTIINSRNEWLTDDTLHAEELGFDLDDPTDRGEWNELKRAATNRLSDQMEWGDDPHQVRFGPTGETWSNKDSRTLQIARETIRAGGTMREVRAVLGEPDPSAETPRFQPTDRYLYGE
jgi:hypothetical protein